MKKFIKHEGRLSLAIPLMGTIGGERSKTYRKPKALVLVGMETDGHMAMSEAGKRHAQKLRDAEDAMAALGALREREPSAEDDPSEEAQAEFRRAIEATKQRRAAHEKARESRRRRKDKPASDDDE